MRLIGDIHGNWPLYKTLLEGCDQSIQAGDFGFGFNAKADADMLLWQTKNLDHRFIRGNHDNPSVCRRSYNYLEDGSFVTNDVMVIGGAWSIDYGVREENVSWWEDEECSTPQFRELLSSYVDKKPRVMITHDVPLSIASWSGLLPKGATQIHTRTGLWLDKMFYRHKPDLWVFGHWHKNLDVTLDGTRFICLGINQCADLNLETLEVTHL